MSNIAKAWGRDARRAVRTAALGLALMGLLTPPRLLLAQGSGGSNTTGSGAAATPAETPLPAPELLIPGNVQADLVAPAAAPSYIIGDNDLLSVFVYQMPEMTRQVRVSTDGYIRIPFAQKNFAAAGKTAAELQQQIAADLIAEGLVRAPVVQVTVVQVESKPIVVTGAVQKPGVVQAARPMRLLEVLSSVGGLTASAGGQVLVTTATDGSSFTNGISKSYNLTQLIRFNSEVDDPLLTGNEMVTVLPAQMIYVVGDFKQPGAFPLSMGEPITVLKAIGLARGFDTDPDKSKAEIIRTSANGVQSQIPIDVKAIEGHRIPDQDLQAGDILYVTKDTGRQVLLTALTDAAQVITLGAAYHLP